MLTTFRVSKDILCVIVAQVEDTGSCEQGKESILLELVSHDRSI